MGISHWLTNALITTRNTFIREKLKRSARSGEKLSDRRVADVKLLKATDPDLYLDICSRSYSEKCKELRKKEKISVSFVVANASMWSCEVLYGLFEKDDRFDVRIVITYTSDASGKKSLSTFRKTCDYFSRGSYRYVKMPPELPRGKCYEAMGKPDIVFYLSPYNIHEPNGCNLFNLPQSVLSVYIPYSYMLSYAPNKFHKPGMDDTWRHFADSEFYRQLLIADDPLKKRNTCFVGYPKMDIYYEAASKPKKEIWKFADPDGSPKCIIYAPHHSLPTSNVCTQHFSTFHDNYETILQIAKDNPKTTSWIIKPHPLLIETAVETGLFPSESAYEDYLAQWAALPNAKVVEESTYYDIFKTSDAMILDSVSFTAEYQFTGKPALFLTKEAQKFNEFGEKVQSVLYHAPGNDEDAIKAFVQRVVIDGEDTMEPERKKFFAENLDYRKNGEPSASRQIFDHILKEIEKA